MNKKVRVKLDKKDYLRALLSDTTPADVPLIFSNDGFYINSHRFESSDNSDLTKVVKFVYKSVIRPVCNKERAKKSSPYSYKIHKSDGTYRTLSLIHPRAQRNFVDFYKSHSSTITNWCSISKLSVRAPAKVGNSLYLYNAQPHNKYKEINIDTLESEIFSKHSSSYFSYKGFSRFHKLYSSKKYIDLEKKFSKMWQIDVANCFDSIYTHSISWAVKNKQYSQDTARSGLQVCGQFDRLMQRSNNNETNGITIGAEISRVFSEIIFQAIDINILHALNDKYGYSLDRDFTILRYVDDFVVFADSNEVMDRIYSEIQDCLYGYRMNINVGKMERYDRPFLTKRSMVVIGVNKILTSLDCSINSHLQSALKEGEGEKLNMRRSSFIRTIVDDVKVLIVPANQDYSAVSSYLISAISRKIIAITEEPKLKGETNVLKIKEIILTLIETIFFFFRVSPSIVSSQKIATAIVVVDKFFSTSHPIYVPDFREEVIYEVEQTPFHTSDTKIVSLEGMNLLIAISDFGANQLLPIVKLKAMQSKPDNLGYFEVISLFYYYKNHSTYKCLKADLESKVSEKLVSEFNLRQNSESLHLFLDLMSCPYVSISFKKRFILKFMRSYEAPSDMMLSNNVTKAIQELATIFWFVNWNEIDLLKVLERNKLRVTY